MKKVLAIVAVLIASPAAAQDKATVCQVSRGFVEQAVEARVEGLTERQTKASIKEGITENRFMWSLVLGPLVSQVFDLPMEKMTPEFGEKFETVCLEQ
ncbi:MAG: hypothetical protein P8L32_03935 [Paracoccaceae bacterium]|nr:hypothetical protein [Paracoccaceae bacterium]